MDVVELYRLIGATEVDPGDGTLKPTIEDVLARGFHAMGWASPTLAAYEACYAVAQRLTRPYVSSTAEKFAPGNFVTTWNPELGRDAVGVTRAIEDPQEANPRVLVKWMHDLSEEWVRSEYLYLAKA